MTAPGGPYLYGPTFPVSDPELLANGRKCFQVQGRQLVLLHVNGEYFCMDSQCWHFQGPLHAGEIQNLGRVGEIEDLGDRLAIVCPWHRYKMDVKTGEHLETDLEGNLRSNGPKQRTHPVEVSADGTQLRVRLRMDDGSDKKPGTPRVRAGRSSGSSGGVQTTIDFSQQRRRKARMAVMAKMEAQRQSSQPQSSQHQPSKPQSSQPAAAPTPQQSQSQSQSQSQPQPPAKQPPQRTLHQYFPLSPMGAASNTPTGWPAHKLEGEAPPVLMSMNTTNAVNNLMTGPSISDAFAMDIDF